MKYLLFCGGGSAGHVVPNLAIMRELRFSYKLAYMGTSGIEKRLVTEAGYPFFTVETPKLVRSFTLSNLKIPSRLARARREALAILRKEKPDLVFSKGGFASYPAVWAAHKLRIPVLTHESDLSPGLCTKLIAEKCARVLTSFPETANLFKNGECVFSPIRKEVLCGERTRARKKYGLEGDKPVLLVFGGGSGCSALNEAIATSLDELLSFTRILHIYGKGNAPLKGREGYVSLGFERDMGSAYACADAVLCRAGSNTVFELLALKKPALLVPLVRGSRGDQAENAAYFEKKGLVRVLPETSLDTLPDHIRSLLSDEKLRSALAASSYPSGTPQIIACIERTLK